MKSPHNLSLLWYRLYFDLNVKDEKLSVYRLPGSRGKWQASCVKGRFGTGFIHHPDRLTQPLIKKDGEFVTASWEEALSLIAEKFSAIKAESGGDALAVLSSARCTNEDNYLANKLTRAVFGTNNIDHCARL